jgi:two-component system, OmpR family, sensor histidine kinase BaeS
MRALRRSLGAKLLLAQLLVVVAGGVTLLLLAFTTGPRLFDRHLQGRVGDLPAALLDHVHMAFEEAVGTALLVAVAAATLTAVVVSAFVTRRVVAPIRQLADSAADVAAGRYEVRVPVTGEDELATLATAFNHMAQHLADTERVRTRLIADVAHELRTPLATLDGYLEGLTDGVIAAQPSTWQTMRDQTRRMARLAEDLALVSRAEERRLDLRPRQTDAGDLVRTAAQAAGPRADAARIALVTTPAPTLPPLLVDPERMQQVLANLLDNALRHTPPGGRVSLTTAATGDDVLITVTDTGDGIPREELEQIFARFHRTDPARAHDSRGSGIGLTVARAIVEAHHGTLVARSEGSGRGSTFEITLPAAAARPARKA